MTEKELQIEIAAMWADMRKDGRVVVDAPAHKVGMPHTAPYEGVCFPIEIDGAFTMVSIPATKVAMFAAALVALTPASIKLDEECESECAAHEAICRARGGK